MGGLDPALRASAGGAEWLAKNRVFAAGADAPCRALSWGAWQHVNYKQGRGVSGSARHWPCTVDTRAPGVDLALGLLCGVPNKQRLACGMPRLVRARARDFEHQIGSPVS